MNIILLILFIIITIFILLFIIKIIFNLVQIYNPTFTDIKTGCKYNRWGCCSDDLTPKLDFQGSNCIETNLS